MVGFEVRLATEADAVAIGIAHSEAWRVAYVDLFPPDFLAKAVAERLRRWPLAYARGAQPAHPTYVPVLDGKVVGLSTIRPSMISSKTGEILGFYLHPEAWGSGAAWALMQHSLELLSADGFTGVHLWTHPGAHRAHSFYLKAGFAPTGKARSGVMISGFDPVPTVEFFRALGPSYPQKSELANSET